MRLNGVWRRAAVVMAGALSLPVVLALYVAVPGAPRQAPRQAPHGPQAFSCRGATKADDGQLFPPSASTPGGRIYYASDELEDISLCSFAGGPPYVTKDDANDFDWDSGTAVFAGRDAALELVFRNEPSDLAVVDLAAHRLRFDRPLGGYGIASVGERIGAIVLQPDGDVAWTEQAGKPRDDSSGLYEVLEHDGGGTRVLDATPTRPGSLRLRGSTLTWRERSGASKSATLH